MHEKRELLLIPGLLALVNAVMWGWTVFAAVALLAVALLVGAFALFGLDTRAARVSAIVFSILGILGTLFSFVGWIPMVR
jgi:hypothetical protein